MPVPLELPNQWLWDIVDEFVYQFQSYCQVCIARRLSLVGSYHRPPLCTLCACYLRANANTATYAFCLCESRISILAQKGGLKAELASMALLTCCAPNPWVLQYRSVTKNKTEDEMVRINNNPQMWHVQNVLHYLQAIVEKSHIDAQLIAFRDNADIAEVSWTLILFPVAPCLAEFWKRRWSPFLSPCDFVSIGDHCLGEDVLCGGSGGTALALVRTPGECLHEIPDMGLIWRSAGFFLSPC